MYESSVDKNKEGMRYPHQRRVDWFFNMNPILRSKLPNAVLGSLRYPGTLAGLTKHYELIKELLEHGTINENPYSNLQAEALDILRDLLKSEL